MTPELANRVQAVVAGHLDIDPGRLADAGTTVVADPEAGIDGWVTLWPAAGHVVAHVPAPLADEVQAVVDDRPRDHRLSLDDLVAAWADRPTEIHRDHVYVLDPATFRPAEVTGEATVRRLDETDRDAFDRFLARCSEEDREEGEVDVADEMAAGVLLGERIAAVASVYTWRGFEDIGVLVDPDLRRRGYAAAAVSHLCQALAAEPVVACYRVDEVNTGSRAVAESLRLAPLGPMELIRLTRAQPSS